MLLYHKLPDDIRNYIRQFLPLWGRIGLISCPVFPPIHVHDAYYRQIRKCPSGIEQGRYLEFYYNRDPLYRWRLMLDFVFQNDDYFVIEMYPKKSRHPLNRIVGTRFYDSVSFITRFC